ncbi:SHOCT domain-containing protein [Paenibacillus sp. LHD-38]|uniref:SHOCT domain-containing protein n=1 Tax=Paenibacillus sp. LHD-38 TaxID=3072143 RepID=UPI00280EFEDE|nr:SHOCT domain-containing protein [Paenibacillus sp. LHD-38]MDQ8733960.1 SHOCT domain-containing protein [Paenibacillus sp. LHD-38]
MMGGMMSYSSMMWMCVMMIFAALAFVVVLGITVYLVIRLLMRNSRVTDRPLMILKERYARGEINVDEYKEMRMALND